MSTLPTERLARAQAEGDAPRAGNRPGRPYERPRIIHRESLEAMAADCSFTGGKGDPTCVVGFS